MTKKQIVTALKAHFSDWDITTDWDELVDSVLNNLGVKTINEFTALGWQEQDSIINVLQAIRG